jgi:hypothetical protein
MPILKVQLIDSVFLERMTQHSQGFVAELHAPAQDLLEVNLTGV